MTINYYQTEDGNDRDSGGVSTPTPVGRDKFGSKFQYLMTSISYSVGLGNVWRFPYFCYRNGGGTFLFAYFISMIFLGLIYFFFESVMGQYTGNGPMKLWYITPIMSGISMASMVLVCFLSIYYNVLIAWAVFFFYESFKSPLPWSICHTEECNGFDGQEFGTKNLTPSTDYFFNVALKITDDAKHLGGFRFNILICLIIAWIIVYLCLCFGAKILGKISFFTTLFPYIMLTALTVQGSLLDGAKDGISHFLSPKFEKIAEPSLWADAGSQIFYSLSIGMGGVITLASYNRFHNNTLRDTLIIVSVNTFTSIFSGFAVFSVIGYLAKQRNESIEHAVDAGVGLAFIAYPAALSEMPSPNIWSAVFFFMIIVLGFGSQFTLVETASANILDKLPDRYKLPKFAVLAITCFIFFLLALPMCTGAGYYYLQLMDSYAVGYSVFVLGICEAISFAWFYGADRILDHFHTMAGYNVKPRWYWKNMLKYVSPVVILAILILSIANFKSLSIPVKGQEYEYPIGVEVIGFCMTFISILMIPIYAFLQYRKVMKGEKSFSEILCSPTDFNNNESN